MTPFSIFLTISRKLSSREYQQSYQGQCLFKGAANSPTKIAKSALNEILFPEIGKVVKNLLVVSLTQFAFCNSRLHLQQTRIPTRDRLKESSV